MHVSLSSLSRVVKISLVVTVAITGLFLGIYVITQPHYSKKNASVITSPKTKSPLPQINLTLAAQIASASALPTEWAIYTNKQYAYSIAYPQQWDFIEATKQPTSETQFISKDYLDKGQLQKVSFMEASSPIYHGEFEMGVLPNSQKKTLQQWVDGYRQQISGGDMIPRQVRDTYLNGKPAKLLELHQIADDEPNILIVSLYKENFYYLLFADYSVVNGISIAPEVDILIQASTSKMRKQRNKQIYDYMWSTLSFLQ